VGIRAVPVNLLRRLAKRGLQLTLLLIGGVVVAFLVVEYSDAPWAPSARWVALLIYTPIVFGAVVPEFRRSWERMTFWLAVVGLVAVHIAAYVILLTSMDGWRNVWFLPLSMAECPALIFVLHTLGYAEPPMPPSVRHV
jgi:peptidoglycan/LPS O-acetylase OafA/YrhL